MALLDTGQVKHVSLEEKHTLTSHGTVGTEGGKERSSRHKTVGSGVELEVT